MGIAFGGLVCTGSSCGGEFRLHLGIWDCGESDGRSGATLQSSDLIVKRPDMGLLYRGCRDTEKEVGFWAHARHTPWRAADQVPREMSPVPLGSPRSSGLLLVRSVGKRRESLRFLCAQYSICLCCLSVFSVLSLLDCMCCEPGLSACF